MSKLKSWPTPDRKWWQKKRSWLFILSLPFLFFVVFLYQREIIRISDQKVSAWTDAPTADCAVALTGGRGRLKEALDLLIRGQVKKVVIAGVNPKAGLRDIYPQLFIYPQIKTDDLVLERRSETTFGNAQQSLPIVEALSCKDILLVTSRSHMYRAYRVFKSTYPDEIEIKKYAVLGASWTYGLLEIFVEASKSLFYSLWAY